MADSGWGCKSNGANPRWGCKSNFDGAVSPMGRYVHTNWGAQYRGAVSPASLRASGLCREPSSRRVFAFQDGGFCRYPSTGRRR